MIADRDAAGRSRYYWDAAEAAALKRMAAEEGPIDWESKAQRLGTGRTSRALQARWAHSLSAPRRSAGSRGKLKPRRRMCEDCGKKWPSFGLHSVTTQRWCADCGKPHGAVRIRVPSRGGTRKEGGRTARDREGGAVGAPGTPGTAR